VQRIKFKQLDHWQYQYLDTLSELYTGAKMNCKSRQENEETTNHPRTASPKGRRRLFVSSQKTGRKGPDEVRRSLRSINYKTGGICSEEGRSTNIRRLSECTNTTSTQQCCRQLDASRQKYRKKQEK